MLRETDGTLAKITPVDSKFAGKALNTWNSLWLNLVSAAFIIVFIAAIPIVSAPILLLIFLLGVPSEFMVTTFLLAVCLGIVAIVVWAYYCYSDWPSNRLLCNRFLRVVELTAPPVISPYDSQTRVVELVPRERWNIVRLDTATDLMLLRVDDDGVWMKGDYFCYEFPCESILSAEHYPRDPVVGGPTRVLIYVRTEEGTIELPITYRDYGYGSLRNSVRYAETVALAERINSIAKGFHHTPVTDSNSPTESSMQPTNPYAAPTM